MQLHALSVPSQSKSEESTKSLTLKWVNSTVVDVFRGNGWENWTRFRRVGSHYEMVAGQPLTTSEYVELKNAH